MDAHDQKTQQQESRATADRRGSKLLSETGRIEMHHSELLKNNQSQQGIMLYKIAHDQSTSSPEAECSRNVAIYITRDYTVRQTKNLAFIVIHHDE